MNLNNNIVIKDYIVKKGGICMKHTTYKINGQMIDIDKLMQENQGNAQAVCQHICSHCLVDYNVAMHYVNLYMNNKPFKKKDSTLSTLACVFCLPLLFCAPLFLYGISLLTSSILAIIDLCIMGNDKIPTRHLGSIVALIICGLSLVALFVNGVNVKAVA